MPDRRADADDVSPYSALEARRTLGPRPRAQRTALACVRGACHQRTETEADIMDCGTFLLLQSPSAQDPVEVFARATEMAQTADRLGFDSIWCAEHHFSTYGYLSRPLMFAMHLAAHTERIRVGSAVVVLPLHHPLVVFEEIATADLLSGGRLDVGLGRGYQPYEFERLGHTLDESRERFDESVDILLKAFAGEPFSHEGKYYSFGETSVFPLPIQKPHPPIWDGRAEPRIDCGDGSARLQSDLGRLWHTDRAVGRVPRDLRPGDHGSGTAGSSPGGAHSARST